MTIEQAKIRRREIVDILNKGGLSDGERKELIAEKKELISIIAGKVEPKKSARPKKAEETVEEPSVDPEEIRDEYPTEEEPEFIGDED